MKAIQVDKAVQELYGVEYFELSKGTVGVKGALVLHGHGWCEKSTDAVASGVALPGQRLLRFVKFGA